MAWFRGRETLRPVTVEGGSGSLASKGETPNEPFLAHGLHRSGMGWIVSQVPNHGNFPGLSEPHQARSSFRGTPLAPHGSYG